MHSLITATSLVILFILIPYYGALYRVRGGLDIARRIHGWPRDFPGGTQEARLAFCAPYGCYLAVCIYVGMAPLGATASPVSLVALAALPFLVAASAFVSLLLPHSPYQDMGTQTHTLRHDLIGMSLTETARNATITIPLSVLTYFNLLPSLSLPVLIFMAFGLLHGPAYALGYRLPRLNHPEISTGTEVAEVLTGLIKALAAFVAFALVPALRAFL